MTEQEAIGYLKTLPNRIPLKFYTDNGIKVYDEFSQVVTSALEKQIPKKPKTDDRYVMYICPWCNDFVKVSHNYCPNCGQELDWGDEE